MQTRNTLANQNARRLEKGYRLWTVLKTGSIVALVLVLIGGVFGTMIGAIWFLQARRLDDIADAPDRSGQAVVLTKAIFYTKNGSGIQATFSIDGHKAGLRNPFDSNVTMLQEGVTVPVTYRIGKSGTYYVTRFELPPRKVNLPH